MEICRGEELKPSEAVEEFMRKAVEIGSVKEALSFIVDMEPKAVLSRELKIKALMSDILGDIEAQNFFDYYEEHMQQYMTILSLLPGIRDSQLLEEVKSFCERVNKVLRGTSKEEG